MKEQTGEPVHQELEEKLNQEREEAELAQAIAESKALEVLFYL